MSFVYIAPYWFYGYDVILEFVFAVVALIVSIYAHKVYSGTGSQQASLLSKAFAFISTGYIMQSITNLLVISEINQQISTQIKVLTVSLLNFTGFMLYAILMLAGINILFYMTIKERGRRIFWITTALSIAGLVLADNVMIAFDVISAVLLAFVSIHFIANMLRTKKMAAGIITGAFILFFISRINFLFSMYYSPSFYVVGHFCELFAYILIISNLWAVKKKAGTKR